MVHIRDGVDVELSEGVWYLLSLQDLFNARVSVVLRLNEAVELGIEIDQGLCRH